MNAEVNPELLIIAIACLGLGLVMGVLLTRLFSAPARQRRHLAEELKNNRQTSATYQHEITEHFVKTADLVENLTASYAELHQHLATSATKLANPETGRRLAEAGSKQLELILPETAVTGGLQAPKDYAPSTGVLSEGYGLVDKKKRGDKLSLKSIPSLADNDEAEERDPTLKAG